MSAAESARKPTGKVVGIIKRNWRPYCGMLNPSQIKEVSLDCSMIPYTVLHFKCRILYKLSFLFFFSQSTRHLFTPADRRIPRIRIETRQASTLAGHRIMVAMDGWPRHSRYPNVSCNFLFAKVLTENGIVFRVSTFI